MTRQLTSTEQYLVTHGLAEWRDDQELMLTKQGYSVLGALHAARQGDFALARQGDNTRPIAKVPRLIRALGRANLRVHGWSMATERPDFDGTKGQPTGLLMSGNWYGTGLKPEPNVKTARIEALVSWVEDPDTVDWMQDMGEQNLSGAPAGLQLLGTGKSAEIQ